MNGFDVTKLNIRHVAGEVFLIDSDISGGYHKPLCVNETGELIVSYLKEGCSIIDTAEKLARIYDTVPSEMEEDIGLFLEALNKQYEIWK